VLRAFAVEPTAVQIDWHSLPAGPHEVGAGDRLVSVIGDGGPGAVVIDGLPPATTTTLTLDGRRVTDVTTLTPPPGRLLARVATIGDLHLGETGFGMLPRLVSNPDPVVAHPVVCTAAAIDELLAWGAQLLVVKGDIAHEGTDAEYELAGELLSDLPVPTMVMPGNHDGGNHGHRDPAAALARHGLRLIESVTTRDVPGLRVVAVDTRTRTQAGTVAAATDDVVAAVSEAEHGALVVLHHQLMTTALPTYPPPGVPAAAARPFLDAVAAAHPATVVTSGHTHRHRARRHGPVLVTEVGSTKDYPGTWAGYLVYEGGIVQTVHRVMAPEAIRWTERTARMLGGAWGRWSPGSLDDRCVTVIWP
jgi:3',5'-cyclic AMP phosphodiesterase CpdA